MDLTNKEEVLDFFDLLCARAESGDHSKFEFIRNTTELKVAKALSKGTRKVAEQFDKASRASFKKYIKAIKANTANVKDLINSTKLRSFGSFYYKEAELYDYMIEEYLLYLGLGHTVAALLGCDRPEEDLFDVIKAMGRCNNEITSE